MYNLIRFLHYIFIIVLIILVPFTIIGIIIKASSSYFIGCTFVFLFLWVLSCVIISLSKVELARIDAQCQANMKNQLG